MPEDCSIGQRNSTCWRAQTSAHSGKCHRVKGDGERTCHVHQQGPFLGAMSQWPQPSLSSRIALPLGDKPSEFDTGFTEATTQTTSPAMSDVEPTRHITPPDGMEEENQYMLVITALIRQLNLGSAGNDLGESSTAPPRGDTFWNPCMAAVLSGSRRRVVSYQGATKKELEEWCRRQD